VRQRRPGSADDRTTATAAIIIDDVDDTPSDRAFMVVYYDQGPTARSQVVPLGDGVAVSVGRLPSNTVPIDHEQVSRNHATIMRTGGDIVVEDLGSRNGTRVNGVATHGPTRVSPGDEITIGPVTAIVGVTTAVRRNTLVGTPHELDDRLAAEVDRAVRYRRSLGLAMIRLDGSDDAAVGALNELGRNLRTMDYLAQYGPEEYAVVLPEADRVATESAARRIAREARRIGAVRGGLKVHVGMAVCPDDGAAPGELVSRARAALRAARNGAGADGVSAAPAERVPIASNVVVVDPLMKRVFDMVSKVADTPITVLILGETGVGKDIVANAMHEQSDRADKPFVTLNCSALPETLLESELFGHERGSFTGADRRKLGYFEAAAGGTIFLDEIGEMPLGVQAKLLRVLEQRTITRVGGTSQIDIDVRVLCATNRNLELECQRGRFREDLFFRISAFTLVVPPLRDRPSEIRPLAHHFARQFALELGQPPPVFSDAALALLDGYPWTGNVRELRNAIERAVVLAPGGKIVPEHLPERIAASAAKTAKPSDVKSRVASVERNAVLDALDACDGNQTRAARRLGISRFALIRLMQKYGLKKKR